METKIIATSQSPFSKQENKHGEAISSDRSKITGRQSYRQEIFNFFLNDPTVAYNIWKFNPDMILRVDLHPHRYNSDEGDACKIDLYRSRDTTKSVGQSENDIE
ncbi:MAG TPA: hypothetical protein VFI73_12960 [Candidatus Nitrosopolaris sp.]|nr:hypothetical protein [Candidatus Nitrosopolaris sp.]